MSALPRTPTQTAVRAQTSSGWAHTGSWARTEGHTDTYTHAHAWTWANVSPTWCWHLDQQMGIARGTRLSLTTL